MAYLVGPLLEQRDALSYEGRYEVISLQLAPLDELEDMGIVPLNLSSPVGRVVVPVVLLDRSTSSVVWQVDQVHC